MPNRLHLEMWPKGRNERYGSWPMSSDTARRLRERGTEGDFVITAQEYSTLGDVADNDLVRRVILERGSATLFWSE